MSWVKCFYLLQSLHLTPWGAKMCSICPIFTFDNANVYKNINNVLLNKYTTLYCLFGCYLYGELNPYQSRDPLVQLVPTKVRTVSFNWSKVWEEHAKSCCYKWVKNM